MLNLLSWPEQTCVRKHRVHYYKRGLTKATPGPEKELRCRYTHGRLKPTVGGGSHVSLVLKVTFCWLWTV
ncbi:hypothetical protein GOP47_0004255 [Adiantum capillus-veneris]|uniref:Uncharacterized protein n=1 Tax=Adiantum capillus-veneris TaxID=13818 RepID=A0A9D4V8Y2_ADICA|nr:hypothetical protein GOP47_0004255 [Adiantum capillus-veneris]